MTLLLIGALADIEQAGLTIASYCPIVSDFLTRHPEFSHPIDPARAGNRAAL